MPSSKKSGGIVSNPPDRTVSHALTLASNFQKVTSEFATEEERLLRKFRTDRAAANRTQRELTEAAENRALTHSAQVEADSTAAEARIRAIYEARRERVQRLKINGLRNLPKQAQQAKERWMGDLQMRKFHAERKLATEQTDADKAHAQFSARLAEIDQRSIALKKRTTQAFSAYSKFQRMLRRSPAPLDPNKDPQSLLIELHTHLATAEEELARFQEFFLPKLFSTLPHALTLPLIVIIGLGLAFYQGPTAQSFTTAAAGITLLIALIGLAHYLGGKSAHPAALSCSGALVLAQQISAAAAAAAESQRTATRHQSKLDFDQTADPELIAKDWSRSSQIEAEFETRAREKIETQVPRLFAQIATFSRPKLQVIAHQKASALQQITELLHSEKSRIADQFTTTTARLDSEEITAWSTIEAHWQSSITPLYEELALLQSDSHHHFLPWTDSFLDQWSPSTNFTPATRFATLHLDLTATSLPQTPRLPLPHSPQLPIPLSLTYPEHGSLLFETHESAGPEVIDTFGNVILRLLSTTPPGKLAFTIIDPVGLGKNFAGLMHLADYEESLINRRIWTQRDHIEARLNELAEQIEKIIQMYLRNE
ncbi:MAG: ATP-binding protein, partial [Verrucomicrobia bacterium]|nr:ATP-binding protein [Verrucomicrobiota bacterium]